MLLAMNFGASTFKKKKKRFGTLGNSPGGLLGLIFAGYVPLASQSPYPIIVCSVGNYRPPSQSILGKYVIFAIPT